MANFPFQRLTAELSSLIARTPAGQQLPSEPDLAKQLGVSRATLREAMRAFETQGLIRRRQGAGTFVVGKVPVMDSGLEVLESVETMARRMNLSVTVSDLHIEKVMADQELATALNVPLATRLTRVRRVMQTDGHPVAYLVDILTETVLRPRTCRTILAARCWTSCLPVPTHPAPRGLPSVPSVQPRRSPRRWRSSAAMCCCTSARSCSIPARRSWTYSMTYFIPGYFNFHVVRRVGNGG